MTSTVEANKKSNKWVWIGLAGAALFCLCAVGVLIFIFARIGQRVEEGIKTNPEDAATAAHAIADYELPPGYQEQSAMDLFMYSAVFIAPESTNSSSSHSKLFIMLAQIRIGTDPQQMEEQIRRSFEQQSGRRGLSMKVVETKQMTIRGEEAEVVTYEGTDDSGYIMRQLITTFPGKDGTAMLMIMGSAQYWNQEEIDAFIESIH